MWRSLNLAVTSLHKIFHRLVFECANILHLFFRRQIITKEEKDQIYINLISLSKRITNFQKSLKINL